MFRYLNVKLLNVPSYIKDTTHFLKKLDDLKELPPGSLLVTLDVSSLHTNYLTMKESKLVEKPSALLITYLVLTLKPNLFVI